MPVVSRNELEPTLERLRAAVVRRWEPFPDARAFLADRVPYAWKDVRLCGTGGYKTAEQVASPDSIKVWPYRCGNEPWCLECVNHQQWRRTQRVMERWAKCTPAGEQPRFCHIVITAPIYDAAPSWGLTASRNPRGFMDTVWRVLTELYGPGLGAHMSYQDFGEAGLARRHPHIDLTINGWTIQDGKVGELPNIGHGTVVNWTEGPDPHGKTYDELVATVERYANALHPGAQASSIYVSPLMEGYSSYQQILSYQVRELVDLRKLRYDRTGQQVGWESYKEPYETTWMPIRDWFRAFEEYCARLNLFNEESGRKLHYDYGHMTSGRIRATQRATGGLPDPHPSGCPCSRCGEWRRVFLHGGDLADWLALASPYDA
jgi:hypothetical protein